MDAHRLGGQLAVDGGGSERIVTEADAQEGEFRGRAVREHSPLREARGALAGRPGLDEFRWQDNGGDETPVLPGALASSLPVFDGGGERSSVVRLHRRRSRGGRAKDPLSRSFAATMVRNERAARFIPQWALAARV